MKRLIFISALFFSVVNLVSAQKINSAKHFELKQKIMKADKLFINKKWKLAKENYIKILNEYNIINTIQYIKIKAEIEKDIKEIELIPFFNKAENILKKGKQKIDENSVLEGIEHWIKAHSLFQKKENTLSNFKTLSFLNNIGYENYLIDKKLKKISKKNYFQEKLKKRSIMILSLNIKESLPDKYNYFSNSIPRSIRKVLSDKKNYLKIHVSKNVSKTEKNQLEKSFIEYRNKNIDYVIIGNLGITQEKKIEIALFVYDSFTKNQIAGAKITSKPGTYVFDAIDKITYKINSTLQKYSRDDFYKIILFNISDENNKITVKTIRSKTIKTLSYKDYMKSLNTRIKNEYLKLFKKHDKIISETWDKSPLSETYLEKAHRLVLIQDEYEKRYEKRDDFFLNNKISRQRVIDTYKHKTQIEKIDKLIVQRNHKQAEEKIAPAELELKRLNNKFPRFRFAYKKCSWKLFAKSVSLRQSRGLQIQIIFKIGYFFPLADFGDKHELLYPIGQFEIRVPIISITPWLHLNLGAEAYAFGTEAIPQEPNKHTGIMESIYQLYSFGIIGNIIFKFLPLHWLHTALSFGFGFGMHYLDAANARDDDAGDSWDDNIEDSSNITKQNTTFIFKLALDVQFRLLSWWGIILEFSYLYSSGPKFYNNVTFYSGTDTDINIIENTLQRESYSIFNFGIGIFFAF